jgi:hypothetical protein
MKKFRMRDRGITRLARTWARIGIVLLAGHAPAALRAQEEPKPISVAANLLRLEGTDTKSGIHYVRIFLSLPPAAGQTTAPPRFTVECSEVKGKHDMSWFMSFGGIDRYAFEPPFHATKDDLFAPIYPNVNLKMSFSGYTRSKPYVRAWAALPSGELRYRNPGMDSPNMESARYFLQFLVALPGFSIGHARSRKEPPDDIVFQTQPLLDELRKTPVCQP